MSYLDTWLNGKNLAKFLNKSVSILQNVDFDTIAVRGQSGMLMGAPLAAMMGKDLIIVRKNIESSHSEAIIEGWGRNQKILIVDDFIESGATVDDIYEQSGRFCDSPKFVGIFLYGDNEEDRMSYQHPDGSRFKIWSIYRYDKSLR